MVEKRVEEMVWILGLVVDAKEGTRNRERGLGDVLFGMPATGTPGVLHPEYHSTAGETCSDGGVHIQYRQGKLGEVKWCRDTQYTHTKRWCVLVSAQCDT